MTLQPTPTQEGKSRVTIDLPWPDRGLHPNARLHWARKAKLTKKARLDAAWMAQTSGASRLKAEQLDVVVTFYAPDARRRDTDGMLSSCKAYLDGLSDVTGVDDSDFNLAIHRGDITPGGRVRIELHHAGSRA